MSGPDEPGKKKPPRGERSIDMGAELMRQAQKKIRETSRQKALPPETPPPAPAQPVEPPEPPRERVGSGESLLVARPKDARPPRRLRTKLLAALVAMLVALILVEIAARIFLSEPEQIRGKPLGPNAFHESLRFPVPGEREVRLPYKLDRQLGFCLAPDYDQDEPFPEAPGGAYRIRTNLLGLRDERPLVPKAQGSLRVLVVGDSMTFGHGVERNQAFPAVLEKYLGSELQVPLDVVNCGVTCWGQREEVAFIQHRAPDLKPDLVLIEFTVANDILDNLRYEDGPGDLVPDRHLGDDLAEHPLLDNPLASTSRAYRLLAWNVGRHVIRYRAMMEPWRIERTLDLLRKGRDASRELGAKFAVVIAPTIVQTESSLAESILKTRRINDAILAGCKADGIPAFDPLPLLQKANLGGKKCYFARDMHWNAEGHAVVGEALAPWIAALTRG
jgi:lysophospholipase L1-like esterase